MPVIIYDTQSQNERAWMVSQLSMILELFNIWAQREDLRGIQYATASADGGAAAFNVLANRSYSERIAIEKMADEDPSDIKISGIIKRLYGRIQKTRSINASSDEGARGTLSLGRCSIKGWDWLELVDGLERAVSQRRQVLASRMFSSPPCWLPFTDSIPVFFAQEIGDLIVPEQPDQVCRQWSPLPGGRSNTYLAVSLRCIRGLSASGCYQNLVWSCEDAHLFEPCQNCKIVPEICPKMPQRLEKSKARKKGPIQTLPQGMNDAVVIFGTSRKKQLS